jgi:iron complex transport system ATP-binding protein
MNDAIETKSLTIAYKDDKAVVEDLCLVFNKRGITSIIGPNGSGKSTILKAIGRLIRPKKGFVLLDGKDIHSMPTKAVAHKMAILPQGPKSPDDITVRDLVTYGRAPYNSMFGNSDTEGNNIIEWAINVTGMRDFTHRYVHTLSGGERQRAWIAMALAQKTDILLLDEPTTFLDIHHQLEVLELLERLYEHHKITIIMVIHDINHASRFSQRIIAVKDGRIIKDGIPTEVITEDTIEMVFNIKVRIITLDSFCKGFSAICIPYGICK